MVDSISESFEEVRDLLSKISVEQGIDLEAILAKPDPEFDTRQKKIKEFRDENETINLAMKYAADFRAWSKGNFKNIF